MINYSYWRTEKPKEQGFSHELISNDLKDFPNTNPDELMTLPFEGIDTLYKALKRNLKRIPNHKFFGKPINKAYQWATLSEVNETALNFAAGVSALGLAPEVEGEG